MYKNIIRGIINKKTGHAAMIRGGVVFTYYYKNNKLIPRGMINPHNWTPIALIDHPSFAQVSIREYLQ